MFYSINTNRSSGAYLRTVEVQSTRKLNANQQLPGQVVDKLRLDMYSEGRAFLAFDEAANGEGIGVWLHKNLDQALAEAKAEYLKRRSNDAMPIGLQIVVAHDDKNERYVSIVFHDDDTGETDMAPDLIWEGNTELLELEIWDKEHGHVPCQA